MREHVLPEIVDLLKPTGLLWIHPRDSRSVIGRPGFPDLIIASHKGLIAREVKPVGVSLSSSQQRWRYAMLAAGINYRVWTDDSLENGTVERELESLR